MLIGAPWNRDPYAVAVGIATNGTTAIALVTDHAFGPESRASAAFALYGTLFHQNLKHSRFVLLSRC